jgi:hypothetical protein
MKQARTGRPDSRVVRTVAAGTAARALWATAALMAGVACSGRTSPSPSSATGPGGRQAPQMAPAAPGQSEARSSDAMPPMMPGRIRLPVEVEPTCPSEDFEEFIRAFFNSGDLQVRFTARPYEVKGPYYEQHNTEPGDPANPQWETVDQDHPLHDLYRYDAHRSVYVSDSAWLRAGEQWTGVDTEGKPLLRPVTEVQIRQVSPRQHAVDTPGRITTFTWRGDCWYLTQDWTLDPFEGCRWPDECRRLLEYEGQYYRDDED